MGKHAYLRLPSHPCQALSPGLSPSSGSFLFAGAVSKLCCVHTRWPRPGATGTLDIWTYNRSYRLSHFINYIDLIYFRYVGSTNLGNIYINRTHIQLRLDFCIVNE